MDTSNSLLKAIAPLVVGAGIEIFTFVDLWNELAVFRTNMFCSAFAVVFLSLALAFFFVNRRFYSNCLKMDSILYLYSYMFLDMPFDFESESFQIITLDDEPCGGDESASLENAIYEAKKKTGLDIYRRLAKLEGKTLKVYGSSHLY